MFLIAGLGNPGEKYKNTRHNVGFLVIDEIAKNANTTTINNSNFKSITQKTNNTILAKPQTFMNLSGESILSIADYYGIDNNEIIIIHDDLDLPFGAVKFKIGGGHGGHNGLRSIDSHIGQDYIRVRVGIGKPINKEVANYVLSDFSKEESNKLEDIIPHIVKAVTALQKETLAKVQSTFTLK
ncbi:MAG: aminoacyl-tRNA hydrolase [Arcobacteraceae bacterium]|nr:aminoacyl-tRNA hydrolase [Arcobacteraceae bacterium]